MPRIDITALKPGVHEVSLNPEAENLALDPERFQTIKVEARLDVHASRILVMLTAQAMATLECDRTLELFDQKIEGSYSLLFAPPEMAETERDEVDDVRVLQPSDQEIDITDAVRDTLLLAVPARCVAPGAEDLDLPTQFGSPADEEADIDPRWEALRPLRSSEEEQS